MIRSIKLLLILVLLLKLSRAHGADFLEAPAINPNRTLVIEGYILNNNILKLTGPMYQMARVNHEPINLVISSGGGDVAVATEFIQVMTRIETVFKTPIRCYVPDEAMSAAFQILVHCNGGRYGLTWSSFLWHPIRTIFPGRMSITAPMASQMGSEMNALDMIFLQDIVRAMPEVEAREIVRRYYQEVVVSAVDLARLSPKFIQVYHYIPGLHECLSNTRVPHAGSSLLEFGMDAGDPGSSILQ